MPPLPISSRISSCGNNGCSSAMAGTLTPAERAVPGPVPVLNPDLIRHSGHRPIGASALRVLPQLGQVAFVTVVLHLLLRKPLAKVVARWSCRQDSKQMAQL